MTKRALGQTVLNVLLLVAMALAGVCIYASYVTAGNGVPSIFGLELLAVQSQSMEPTISRGDLILGSARVEAETLQVGDIITYWTVLDGQRVLNTHRIVGIYDGGDHRIFETQGDANDLPDDLTVHQSEVVGQYTGLRIPGLGKFFNYLQTSQGFLLVVLLPMGLFFLLQLVQFIRVLLAYHGARSRLAFAEEQAGYLAQERQRMEDELRRQLQEELTSKKAQ